MARPPFTRSPGRRGLTTVELSIGLSVLVVALSIALRTVEGVAKQRAASREADLAVAVARNLIESLRSEDFSQVWALYNADPADDPHGPGTAPGNRFAVAGGADAPGDAALAGEVIFPGVEDPVLGWQLREDVELPELGMPRDLSGDSVVDDRDHGDAYFILPVQVRLRWQSASGPRELALTTQLCRYRRS